MNPPDGVGSATCSRELGATIAYSSPRTSTTRAFGPVVMMSPIASGPFRTATRLTPAWVTTTPGVASEMVQVGVSAAAMVEKPKQPMTAMAVR